jgi:cobalamin-dependent methionine synthase I
MAKTARRVRGRFTGSSCISERFKQTVNDYDDILLKALADRLAESFAEVPTRMLQSPLGLCR